MSLSYFLEKNSARHNVNARDFLLECWIFGTSFPQRFGECLADNSGFVSPLPVGACIWRFQAVGRASICRASSFICAPYPTAQQAPLSIISGQHLPILVSRLDRTDSVFSIWSVIWVARLSPYLVKSSKNRTKEWRLPLESFFPLIYLLSTQTVLYKGVTFFCANLEERCRYL